MPYSLPADDPLTERTARELILELRRLNEAREAEQAAKQVALRDVAAQLRCGIKTARRLAEHFGLTVHGGRGKGRSFSLAHSDAAWLGRRLSQSDGAGIIRKIMEQTSQAGSEPAKRNTPTERNANES